MTLDEGFVRAGSAGIPPVQKADKLEAYPTLKSDRPEGGSPSFTIWHWHYHRLSLCFLPVETGMSREPLNFREYACEAIRYCLECLYRAERGRLRLWQRALDGALVAQRKCPAPDHRPDFFRKRIAFCSLSERPCSAPPACVAHRPLKSGGRFRLFVQTESSMDNSGALINAVLIDDDRDLYFGGRNHLDVDSRLSQQFKHFCRDA